MLSRNPPQRQIGNWAGAPTSTLPTLPLFALFALPSFRCAKWPEFLRTRVVQHVGGYSYSQIYSNILERILLLDGCPDQMAKAVQSCDGGATFSGEASPEKLAC
jgi:hypothetical protein